MATEVGTGDRSDPPICLAPRRFDSGRGPRRLPDQLRSVHVAGSRAHLPFGRDRRAGRLRRAGASAGHGGNVLRIYCRHGALRRRRDRHAVFPVCLRDLFLCSGHQPARLLSLHVLRDKPDHHHRRPGADGFSHGHRHRHQRARAPLLQTLRSPRRADLHIAAGRGDRDHLLLVASRQSFGAFVRQHARRPHYAQRVSAPSSSCCSEPPPRSRRSRCCRSS